MEKTFFAGPGDNSRPRLFISKCLTYEACRWDGGIIASSVVEHFKPFFDITTTCPEMQTGLGCPRNPIHLEQHDNTVQVIQPATGINYTTPMQAWANQYLADLGDIDGFILKNRSPSCGVFDTRLYSPQGRLLSGKIAGLFAQTVKDLYPNTPIEDEGRLTNLKIREHFLTRVYRYKALKNLLQNPQAASLVSFHAAHKYLLMCYNQQALKKMGKLVATVTKANVNTVAPQYALLFFTALARPAKSGPTINTLLHIMGYFKNTLIPEEKAHFLDLLQSYKDNQIPLAVLTSLLQSWVLRHKQPYLQQQVFFEPYPKQLISRTDSSK